MIIGIPKEISKGEDRVAVIPAMINSLIQLQHEVMVESHAGKGATFSDEQYAEAGADIVKDVEKLYDQADVILKIQVPQFNPQNGNHEVDMLPENRHLISFLSPLNNLDTIQKLAAKGITAFSMEFVPRLSRAQSMDALSSMANIAGYKAVLLAANHLAKMFPLLMTAAGTVAPANVLVLGAGVAGLQAIATAKRLGAKVEAFDPRPVVKEQVESLGARFVEMELPEDSETEGGYAKEQSEAFLIKEQEVIAARLTKVDVIITTAQIFGKQAPILITEEMVKQMPRGSVIVDLAAEQGGNCALTQADQIIQKHDVSIIGTLNLPARLAVHASQMYSKNITNLFKHLYKNEAFDFEDEITKGACLTHNGRIVNKLVAEAVQKG